MATHPQLLAPGAVVAGLEEAAVGACLVHGSHRQLHLAQVQQLLRLAAEDGDLMVHLVNRLGGGLTEATGNVVVDVLVQAQQVFVDA